MSEETKSPEASAEETPKAEQKKARIYECNKVPEFYCYFQNSGTFRTFTSEDEMRTFLLDFFKEMGDVFGEWDSYKNKTVKELLLEYDKQFLAFIEMIKKKMDNKEKIDFEEKYHNFDRYGRIITNNSVVTIPLEQRKGAKCIISKSLFYHYCELMSVCSKMAILEMSAVFATSSYADGSLAINFDENVPEDQRKTDFVKPFFVIGVDGLSKGISLFFVDSKKPEESNPKAEQPSEENNGEKESAETKEAVETAEETKEEEATK